MCLAYVSQATAAEADFLSASGQKGSRKRRRGQPAATVGAPRWHASHTCLAPALAAKILAT